MSAQGDAVDPSLCSSLMKPNIRPACAIPEVPCYFCSITDCNGRGICTAGKCFCPEGWSGTFCEISSSCPSPGYVDGSYRCCQSGVVDRNNKCCSGSSSSLDKDGYCCSSGLVDPCGVCDGAGKFLDIRGDCCRTFRDERGVCCRSGFIDECHVCNGDSSSCNIQMSMSFDIINSSVANDVATTPSVREAVVTLFHKLITETARVQQEGVKVTGLKWGEKMGSGDETTRAINITLIINFFGGAENAGVRENLDQIRTLKDLIPRLENAEGNLRTMDSREKTATLVFFDIANSLKIVESRRTGVCGNGMCELGERCNPDGSAAPVVTLEGTEVLAETQCCPADCQYITVPCPAPATGPRQAILLIVLTTYLCCGRNRSKGASVAAENDNPNNPDRGKARSLASPETVVLNWGPRNRLSVPPEPDSPNWDKNRLSVPPPTPVPSTRI
ncbi:hypothetical protein CBR_g38856 [Chara braunii]|uniref:Uncharacterized protein n=1 Tax=Chara braunii TaxID=69332 RepID=A0A388LQP7_CHABU|nr:hypothetical protein CBR_g38856 [Chara braunii]|eukprot:GBG84575.1 hypothetical protein CBR_g38856 [Chara braunii]